MQIKFTTVRESAEDLKKNRSNTHCEKKEGLRLSVISCCTPLRTSIYSSAACRRVHYWLLWQWKQNNKKEPIHSNNNNRGEVNKSTKNDQSKQSVMPSFPAERHSLACSNYMYARRSMCGGKGKIRHIHLGVANFMTLYCA